MSAKVRILAGPARCGKTQLLLDAYRKQFSPAVGNPTEQRIPNCRWLAPNHSAAMQIQELLLAAPARAMLSPGVYTFAQFAQSMISRGGRRVRSISSLQKRRLLARVIASAHAARKLQHYSSVAGTPGFVAQIDASIAELKRADTWPEDFQQWCHQRPRGDRRNRELAYLYAQYQAELQRAKLYDAEGRFWAAREILATSPSRTTPYELIVVCGFNDFTSAQLDILRLLSDRSQSMLFSLAIEPSEDKDDSEVHLERPRLEFAKKHQTLVRLRATLPDLQVEYLPPKRADSLTLQAMQQQALREPGGANRPGAEFASVEVVSAGSELGEIEAIAARIKLLLNVGKAVPEDIVLVHRGGEDSVARLESVLPDFGIPFFTEIRPRLQTTPLARALLGLLRTVIDDWPFQSLLEVVGNRLFGRWDDMGEALEFGQRRRVAMELGLRSAQLPAGRDALLEQLNFRVQHATASDAGEVDRRTSQLAIALDELQQFDRVLSDLPNDASVREWVEAIERLLVQMGAFVSASSRSNEAAVWRQMRRCLQQIAQLEDDLQIGEKITLAALLELLEAVAREERVAATHDEVGRVRILSAESARKLTVKHLFLAGLDEQSFSAIDAADSSAVTQASTADGPAAVDGAAVDVVAARNEAMLLFHELITRPTSSLTLSYAALDAKGQPLSPTPLLTDLQHSLQPDRVRVSQLTIGQAVEGETDPVSVGSFRRQAVTRALEGESSWLAGMISQPQLVRSGSSILAGVECVAQRGKRDVFGPFEGVVKGLPAQAALAQRFDREHLWSPSRLENYAACPFRFFAEQLLGLEPLNELTLRNDARRRGSLLHQVLATIHEELSRDPALADGEADADELTTRFLRALDTLVKASPLRGIEQSLREIERREIEAWVPNYAEQELDYRSQWRHLDGPPRPAHFEVRFGPETRGSTEDSDRASTSLPFQLDLGEESILLTGQIDRVDVGQMGDVTVFNIIDYKSGKAVRLKYDKVRSGHQLQLPLYALAAERLLLADQKAVALATGYWNIQGKGFQTSKGGSLQLRESTDSALKVSAEWNGLEPEILDRVQQIVRGIREGDFPVYNADEHCTRSCELSTICRVSQIRSLEKVWPVDELEEAATDE
ncbi:MAG: PD-(D/E)XK nuclease family protein [Planctomycetota bacterium]